MGKRPLLPLIQSVEYMAIHCSHEKMDWSSTDFVTDRKCLRNLLSWVTGFGVGKNSEFRMDTQLAGDKTVLFNQWEKLNKEKGGGLNPSQRSYGHNFEKAATAAAIGCEASTGHHRIITYVRYILFKARCFRKI